VHISIIYAFLIINAWQKFSAQPLNWPVLWAFIIWHFALYLFDRAYDADKDQLSQKTEAVPLSQQKPLIWFSVVLSLAPIALLVADRQSIVPYLILLPFTFLYTFPILPGGKRFKDFFFIKNFYSAFIIWSFSIFWMLKNYAGLPDPTIHFFWNNFSGLLLTTIIGEIHWDMRDIASDTENNVKTLPVVLGLNTTKILIITALLIAFFGLQLLSGFSLVMMIVLVLMARVVKTNIIYHLPPLVALYNFIVQM